MKNGTFGSPSTKVTNFTYFTIKNDFLQVALIEKCEWPEKNTYDDIRSELMEGLEKSIGQIIFV